MIAGRPGGRRNEVVPVSRMGKYMSPWPPENTARKVAGPKTDRPHGCAFPARPNEAYALKISSFSSHTLERFAAAMPAGRSFSC